MKHVVINADDFGLSDGVCRAIMELFDRQAISNTTIMIAADGAHERIRNWPASQLLGVAGVHLQITGGRPLSPPAEVPSLINPSTGTFHKRTDILDPSPEEVEREWDRQIQLVMGLLGGHPTHLDSHQGVHRIPRLIGVYIKLAVKYNLPVRGGGDNVLRLMKSAGVKGADRVIRTWTGQNQGPAALELALSQQLAEMRENDEVVEVVSHPAYSDEYLRSISSLNDARDNDRLALIDVAKSNWLARNDCKLVSYPALN